MSGTGELNNPIQQCIFIKKDGKTTQPPPATIPFNENSTRASSKKHRVYVLRDFIHNTYSSTLVPNSTILDVAGGRGDLSWILHNIDGCNSVIADPRIPNHRRLVKSVNFLLSHPEEAKIRAVEGLPTSQPLAKLLPRLLENLGVVDNNECLDNINMPSPKYLRMHIDNTLVETLKKVLVDKECEVWDKYWEEERSRIGSFNNTCYGGTASRASQIDDTANNNTQIKNNRLALEVFQSLDLVVGFHPDQATEDTIDLALLLNVPFAVVPCCVFPSEFPNRTLNEKRVRTHAEFIDYLCMKHDNIRKCTLPFIETDTAKNVVLYMLTEDFTT